MDKLYVIKIGGNVIDDASKLSSFLADFASIKGNKILVHGGGKLATKTAEQLGIRQEMIDGRRITDAETLNVVIMVYAGLINKNIVSMLQSRKCNAVGLTGADGNSIRAHKRNHPELDFGFVGDVDEINIKFLLGLLQSGETPIFAPLTHDNAGQLLNTNADTIAQEIAKAMSAEYDVELVYTFEKSGVLFNTMDDSTLIRRLNPSLYQELKAGNKIFAGMLPKLDNAFAALDNGVSKVIIGKAEELSGLLTDSSGTMIVNE